MVDISHFEKISIVHANFRAEIDLTRFNPQFIEAQRWLGHQVLEDCKPYMPLLTGSLQQRSYVTEDGTRVVFPGPYGRYQYMGKVMVNSATGKGPMLIPNVGYRYKLGTTLVATERPLTYSNPKATPMWFETAKQHHLGAWIAGAEKKAKGG